MRRLRISICIFLLAIGSFLHMSGREKVDVFNKLKKTWTVQTASRLNSDSQTKAHRLEDHIQVRTNGKDMQAKKLHTGNAQIVPNINDTQTKAQHPEDQIHVRTNGIDWPDSQWKEFMNTSGFDFTVAEMADIVATWRKESVGFKWRPVDILGTTLPKMVPGYRNPCYYDSAQVRCLPYFMIIGVEKCGSTELFNYIASHPKIISPTIKESLWFNQRRMIGLQSLRSYSNYFRSQSIRKMKEAVTGEAPVQYFTDNSMWMDAPENKAFSEPRVLLPHLIKHVVPDVRLVITLRDPVERLWSDYWFYGAYKEAVYKSSAEDFHKRVVQGTVWLQQCFLTLPARHCLYDIPYRHRSHLQRFYYRGPFGHYVNRVRIGIYSEFLDDWLTVFPLDQIHFVTLNEFMANRTRVLEGIYQHLHLELPTPEHYQIIGEQSKKLNHHNDPRKKPEMFSKTREILRKFYRPFNRKLADMLGGNKYLWGY